MVRTVEDLQKLVEVIQANEYLSYDTETNGVDKDSEIIGFSIASDMETGYYLVLAEWTGEVLSYLPTKDHAKGIISLLRGKCLIMHNAGFDCWMTKNNFGIDLMPSVHTDTMLLAHLLDENRPVGLKELGTVLWGMTSTAEQAAMKESVSRNGGQLTKANYELYKANSELIAKYGAKDAILTIKLFYTLTEDLFKQQLQSFFYEDETMPLLRSATYDLNTTGIRVDKDKLEALKRELMADMMEAKAFIYKEITPYVQEKYPATGKTNVFNIGAPKQVAWLLFEILKEPFGLLTKEGKALCKYLGVRPPYTLGDKRNFVNLVRSRFGEMWEIPTLNPKTGRLSRGKKVGDFWNYIACGDETLKKFADKYKWVDSLMQHSKDKKILTTYVEGIQSRMQYGIIRPSFLQHGTTSGRYSSRSPNFQNLPRDDKRIKACMVARPGMVFVAADYAQLEPRVFASVSGDPTLCACFESGEDFYSVVGAPIWGKDGISLFKDDPKGFAKQHPKLRDMAKVVALATPYGRTAYQQAAAMGIGTEESERMINAYFTAYPKVQLMMLESHEQAKKHGVVHSLFGRPRRIPEAQKIPSYMDHSDLPYTQRTALNLAMNHRVQSSGASIMNRASISFCDTREFLAKHDPRWHQVKVILQVHDELVLEGPEELAEEIAIVLKECMENTVVLPSVKLLAEPKIAYNLADLK